MKKLNVNELNVRTFNSLEYATFQTGDHKGQLEYEIELEGIKYHRRMVAGLYKTRYGFWKACKVQVTLPKSVEFPSLYGLKMTTLYGFEKYTASSYPAVVYLDRTVVTPILFNNKTLVYDEDEWYTKSSDIPEDKESMLWRVPILWGDNPLVDEELRGINVSDFDTYEQLISSLDKRRDVKLF